MAVQIKFVRSGGFAGAATNVAGTVQFDEHGGTVNGEGTDYHRELTPQEVERLRADAAPGVLAGAQTAGSASSAVRDGYQYDITVVADDGKSHSSTLGEDGGVADLRSWIEEESQKIWSHRVSSRKLEKYV
jgi:hypothetical protein